MFKLHRFGPPKGHSENIVVSIEDGADSFFGAQYTFRLASPCGVRAHGVGRNYTEALAHAEDIVCKLQRDGTLLQAGAA